MNKTINIIGRGLNPKKHLTLEGLSALKRSDLILGIESEKETWVNLSETHNFPTICDISSLYINGDEDINNYRRFINYVLTQSQHHQTISLLVAGHPCLGVSFVKLLQLTVKEKPIALNIIEGLSSFDIMIKDLEIDPIDRGMTLLDANRLLLFKYEMEPANGYFIYHVCSVGTKKTNYLDPETNNQLVRLQNYLEKFYPKNKTLYFSQASNGENDKAQYKKLLLSELAEQVSNINFSTTLYIPPEMPRHLDRNFLLNLGA